MMLTFIGLAEVDRPTRSRLLLHGPEQNAHAPAPIIEELA